LLFWISFPSASITAVARRRRGGATLWSEFNGQTMTFLGTCLVVKLLPLNSIREFHQLSTPRAMTVLLQ
jgi:hypothetical protein